MGKRVGFCGLFKATERKGVDEARRQLYSDQIERKEKDVSKKKKKILRLFPGYLVEAVRS
jgi:hypothetical protein